MVQNLLHQNHQPEHKLKFGSFPTDIRGPEELSNGLDRNGPSGSNLDVVRRGNYDSWEQERRGGGGGGGGGGGWGLGKQQIRTTPPPGFPSRPIGGGNWDSRNRGRGLNHSIDRETISSDNFGSNRDVFSAETVRSRGENSNGLGLSAQLDRPGLPSGSSLHSVSVADVEDSFMNLENGNVEVRDGDRQRLPVGLGVREIDDIGERLVGSLLIEEESDDKIESKQHHHSREKVNSILGFCFI